jgi:hypothetical protein
MDSWQMARFPLSRTDPKLSMPPRGIAPGLKIGRTLKDGTRLPYWIAKQVVRDPMGFPDKCIALPPGADMETLAALCHEHTARLLSYLDGLNSETPAPEDAEHQRNAALMATYNDTVLSACNIYRNHTFSNFNKVKHNSRKGYERDLRLIERTVGRRLIRNLTVLDCQHWYNEWSKPATDGGPDRIERAHNAISQFRTVIYFLSALRMKNCKLLAGELEKVKFEKGGARQEELTYSQAAAFIKTALEFGQKGMMPADRCLSLAIGTAAQFELMLRQMDIIGEWAKKGATRKLPAGIGTLDNGADIWAGYFTWEHIPGWRWRMRTSKSKYRSPADFDLTRYEMLMPLLDAVPHESRMGAIVKGEKGLPIRQSMYGRWWRDIARAAGIPDAVWNMDARAGGATEADEAGAAIEAIQGALTHTKPSTTLRYIRRGHTKKIEAVAEARAALRKAEGEEK